MLEKYMGGVSLSEARRMGDGEILELIPEMFRSRQEVDGKGNPVGVTAERLASNTPREAFIRFRMTRKGETREQATAEWNRSVREQRENIRQAKKRERGSSGGKKLANLVPLNSRPRAPQTPPPTVGAATVPVVPIAATEVKTREMKENS